MQLAWTKMKPRCFSTKCSTCAMAQGIKTLLSQVILLIHLAQYWSALAGSRSPRFQAGGSPSPTCQWSNVGPSVYEADGLPLSHSPSHAQQCFLFTCTTISLWDYTLGLQCEWGRRGNKEVEAKKGILTGSGQWPALAPHPTSDSDLFQTLLKGVRKESTKVLTWQHNCDIQ